jgi:hypothetical protein
LVLFAGFWFHQIATPNISNLIGEKAAFLPHPLMASIGNKLAHAISERKPNGGTDQNDRKIRHDDTIAPDAYELCEALHIQPCSFANPATRLGNRPTPGGAFDDGEAPTEAASMT